MSNEEFQRLAAQPVPLDWRVSEEMVTRYATNLVIQHSEHEFTVMFFEVRRPIILGPEALIKSRLEQMDCVPAECVARIVVAPERMAEFARVFQESYQKYLADRKKGEKGE